MNWWNDFSDEQIEFWKKNRVHSSLLNQDELSKLKKIPQSVLQVAIGVCWADADGSAYFKLSDFVCRLRPDWQRPEKKPRFEEHSVVYPHPKVTNPRYFFVRNSQTFHLHKALSMVGYAGVQYKEFPGDWFAPLGIQVTNDGLMYSIAFDQEAKPATPVKVRFLVEE